MKAEVDVLIAQVPLVNALVLGNLCKCCHKSYISKNSLGYIFVADIMGLSSTTLT